MPSLFTDILQNLVWPLLLGVGPAPLRRWIYRHVSQSPDYFAPEVQAMTANLLRFAPGADVVQAARQLRCTHLADKSAPFHPPWTRHQVQQRADVMGPAPQAGQAGLILGAHYGCAWWLLPWLADRGRSVRFVSAALKHPQSRRERLFWPLALWRWRCLRKAGAAPLIEPLGASRTVHAALMAGDCVNALIDIPPVLARGCSPAPFLGGKAYMPMQLIRAACEAGVPVWFFTGYWDVDRDRPVMRFEMLEGDALTIFHQYARELETWLQHEPGRWHCWGHVDAFFAAPAPESA